MTSSFFSHIYKATVGILIMGAIMCQPARAAEDLSEAPDKRRGGYSALDLYQRFISNADGQRCPMYPSCSHYARQSFERHGVFKGWILTCDRLLRCGRDETRLSGQMHGGAYDPLENNTFWWKKKTE